MRRMMVKTLAHLSRFIIADLTDPSSIPYELAQNCPRSCRPCSTSPAGKGKKRLRCLSTSQDLSLGTKPLHEGKILSDLCFQLCNCDATVHMLLQKFVITLF